MTDYIQFLTKSVNSAFGGEVNTSRYFDLINDKKVETKSCDEIVNDLESNGAINVLRKGE